MRLSILFLFYFYLTLGLLADSRPNIILIMLDDSGWTDFGCYGSQIETPNIDHFASEGMRFTDYHAAAPNCSPSRAGILTGRTPSRLGMYSYRPPEHVMHLKSEEITIPELLKKQGYKTGHFGKWHLSTLLDPTQASPREQGFDYTLGTDNNASPNHLNPVNFVRNGNPVGEMKGYSCQVVVNEAISWMDSIDAANNPFFACVWYHEPHSPIASPPELVKKYQKLYPELSKKEATYFANIENVDIATGRLLDYLKEKGIEKDTLVMISSDNGGLGDYSNQGLRGKKSHLWEGGHRVAGIFRWPGTIPAGTESDVTICGIDMLPTICEFTGMKVPDDRKIDGTSIASLLTGDSDSIDRQTPLYWFFYRVNPALALREGKWVLIADTNDARREKTHPLINEDIPFIKASKPVKFMLYDLESELTQRTDVSSQHPETFDRLKKMMIRMHADVISESPAWTVPDTGKENPTKIWDSY
ncbi:MAG: sulfatase [Puniceicoccaceae bacterium]